MNNYDIEVKNCFGKTDAYKEHQQKTANYSKDKWQEVNDGLMSLFAKFAECKQNGNPAESDEAHALVNELQNYITDNYYTCGAKYLQDLAKCTSPMSVSKLISINTATAQPISFQRR